MTTAPSSSPPHQQDRWAQEIEKWDQIYAPQDTWEETEDIRALSNEFTSIVASLLPERSNVLEAGCGSGWQSLALARTGKFEVSLLDFSREALRYSQGIFEQAGIQANFILGNIISPGQPDYDLVFNAGVFEHYTLEEQASLLKGMAGRSRKYVMVIIPNRLCYWYWIARIHLTSQGQWPYGKEVPLADLSTLFQAAGIHFIGNAFMAATWTESFIKALPNLDANLRRLLLEIHHSPIIDPYQKSYLVAGLGCVGADAPEEIPGWHGMPMQENYDTSTLQSIIADILASKIHSEFQLTHRLEAWQTKELEFDQTRQLLLSTREELTRLMDELEQSKRDIQAKEQELEQSKQIQTQLGKAVDSLRTEYDLNLQAKEDQIHSRNNEALAWKNRAETHLADINEIKSSRMWKVVRTVWQTHQNLRPLENRLARLVKPISENLSRLRTRKSTHRPPPTISARDERKPTPTAPEWKTSFQASYADKKQEFTEWLNNPNNFDPEVARQINTILHRQKYKGIIVYPHSVHWEPLQRPQQMLIEFGRQGYLCLFCESYDPCFELLEVSENVYLVPGEKYLLFPLQNIQVIFLCTWMYHMPLIEALPNHLLWYDLIDKIDIFSLYDEGMEEMHERVVKIADIVTYSGLKLKEYLPGRDDAVYLPNAARIEDFANAHNLPIPASLSTITAPKRPIIGYYGALAEWVDLGLIRQLAQSHPEWDFVIIGKSWVDVSSIENIENIHYLGSVPYAELPALAQIFNVAIIPFVINELTDCVSPIKLFEFCALRLPIVTTPFYEVTQYHKSFIKFAANAEEFTHAILECLTEETRTTARESALEFARQHQWGSRTSLIEKLIEQSLAGSKSFANYLPHPYIAAMTGTFFHFDGRDFYGGGAERYLIDLHDVVAKIGIRLVTYQYGSFPWMRKYGSMDVLSLASHKGIQASYEIEAVLHFNRAFYQSQLSRSLINIYSAFVENWPLALHPCIGISHGISWDSNLSDFEDGNTFWVWNKRAIESFRACDAMVSVDTNTANWFQTIDYADSQKIRYLPNYVDLDDFHPRQNFAAEREKIVIIYPRRLYKPRGFYLLLAVMDNILKACPQVEIHFVGRGFEPDTKHVVEKQRLWGERVQWYSRMPDEMPAVYREADITLIPTLYSEGTSLSCLEAMASGNAVIATRVGGLPDLVINNHNGLLIEPNEKALKEAILHLVKDPTRLSELKTKAVEVAKAFNKRAWEEKWKEIIRQMLPSGGAAPSTPQPTRLIEIYLNSLEPKKYVLPLLSGLLQAGFLLYVRIPKEEEALIPESFHRLQFLAWNEEIYATPEITIAGIKVTNLPRPAEYNLTDNPGRDIQAILSMLQNQP